MKIAKNVILCSKLIANLPSYHVYLILYTKKKFQVGGSFGVFFGGFFSDRIVTRLGLHSRLWVLSAFTMLSVPFAFLTLYTPVSPFPRSRNLTKLIFRKHSECNLKKTFQPITSWIMLLIYYFCAETWFAILFTVIIEVVKPEVKGIRYTRIKN